jgi:hypothetical protein
MMTVASEVPVTKPEWTQRYDRQAERHGGFG